MILADKIINLRKKNGWSQEELAEKLNVSRQSVSKWESAASVPDLNKILQMSKIFGVTTDYLLRDEVDDIEFAPEDDESVPPSVKVSMEEANDFIRAKEETAKTTAFATFLCILSPICLLFLLGASDTQILNIKEETAAAIGIIVLLIFVIFAVALFLLGDSKTKRFHYLEEESIDTEYGVSGLVEERKKQLEPIITKERIIATCLCIFAVIPVLTASFLPENKAQDFYLLLAVCILLLIVSVGVALFIVSGINSATIEKLLETGEYTKEKKAINKKAMPIENIYWPIIVATYLLLSFTTGHWESTWIIWPVAGVAFGAIKGFIGMKSNKK